MDLEPQEPSPPEPAPAPAAEPVVQEPPPETSPDQSWTYVDLAVAAVFAVAAHLLVLGFGLVAMLLIRQARGASFSLTEAFTSASFVLPVQFAWWVLVFWIVYRIVRVRDPRPFREAIAWVRPASPVAIYLVGGAVLALSVAALARLLPLPREKMPIEQLFRDPTSAFLLAGFGVLIAPVIEELVFRGFLYPVVERAHGAVAAVVSTAVLFSLVHAPQYGGAWQNLLLVGYVGVIFGAVRAVSGSLVPPTLVHAGYNFTLFTVAYLASNRFQNLERL